MSYLISNARSLLALALFASIVFAPVWVSAFFALALSLRWRAWEVIAAGVIMDFLWLPSSVGISSLHTVPFATLICIIVVFCLEPLRRHLLLGPAIE